MILWSVISHVEGFWLASYQGGKYDFSYPNNVGLKSFIEIEFIDGTMTIPSCYYEFAKRYADQSGNLYQGFVAKSADKIFESTNK